MTDRDRHHAAVWSAVERIAERHGLTPSGLAKLAGLDPTSFNRSKRVKRNRIRWPSTETIAGVLDAAGVTWEEFGGYGRQGTQGGDRSSGSGRRLNRKP